MGGRAHSYFPATHGPVLSTSNTLHSSVEWEGGVHLPDKGKVCHLSGAAWILHNGSRIGGQLSLILFRSLLLNLRTDLAIAGGESSKLEQSSSCFGATMSAIKS